VLPSESEFPFLIDGSKLAFIGVMGVQTPTVRTVSLPMAPEESSRSGEVLQEGTAEGAKNTAGEALVDSIFWILDSLQRSSHDSCASALFPDF